MPPPPPNAAGRILGILIIFLYLYSAPDPYSNSPASGFRSPREQFNAHLARQRQRYQVLNSSHYGDFQPSQMGGRWLNLTGFRQNDSYAWAGMEKVREKVAREWDRTLGPTAGQGTQVGLYKNVTGIVRGMWVRSPEENRTLVDSGRERLNLTLLAPEVHWAYNQWNRNITGNEGKLLLIVEERDKPKDHGAQLIIEVDEARDDYSREVTATMTVGDESTSGEGWEVKLHGLHWPRRGSIVMTTTSGKYAGIFGLPHLTTSQSEFESSQRVLNRTLDNALSRKEKSTWIDLHDPWSADDAMPVPHCEYVVYAQVQPIRRNELQGPVAGPLLDGLDLEISDLEAELRFPNGAPVVQTPPLKISMTVFSPDCGFMLESKGPPTYAPSEGEHLVGLKQEVFVQHIKQWSLIWGAFLFVQVLLIRLQMKESSTPSTLSRISYYTVGMMLGADSLLFGCLMLLAASAPAVFPTATLAAFAVCLSLGLGIRFLTDVYNVQEPERRERERQQTQTLQQPQVSGTATPATAPVVTAAGADTLPLPVTANRPATINDTPIIIPSDQDTDAEIAEVANAAANNPTNAQIPRPPANLSGNTSDAAASYGQYLLAFMCFFFVTVSSASWPTILRDIYINGIGIIYLSFWIPQIYRNIMRNCRKAFLWKFVLGQSILRIIPFAYFYLKKDNVLFAETKTVSMMILAGWLWVQIWILVAQEVLGPRFGLPRGWLPEAWDYHPVLREDDAEGGGMPIGLVLQSPGSPRLERVRTGEEGRKKLDSHTWSVDCAICMQSLEIPVVPAGNESTAGGAGGVVAMLARRLYMVTPCRHAFHSVCLEGWMRFRLQCPICRENLPPL